MFAAADTMPNQSRRQAATTAAALVLLLAGCTSAPAAVDPARSPPAPAGATPLPALPVIRGPLALAAGGGVRGSYMVHDAEVDLVDLSGQLIWQAAVGAADVRLVAEGDFTGDGVPDAIFRVLAPAAGTDCGGQPMATTQLVFVDGALGRNWRPLERLTDLCWDGFGKVAPYATHQWGTGTAYIGAFAGIPGAVVTFPYYATAGEVLRFTGDGFEAVVGRSERDLVFPSTARYDTVYNSTNPEPCTIPYAGGPCFIVNSHVPNLVWSGDHLFVLTSARAFLYRPDFTPSSDLTWISGGRLDNGGRNYGLLSTLPDGGITLIGGCSVINTRSTMRKGVNGNAECSIHHHYEWFSIEGGAVTGHASRYYGYTPADGPWEGRIEYPMHATAAVTGQPGVLFNLFHADGWAIQVLADPARPDRVVEAAGWYAWDTVTLRDGRVAVLASSIDPSRPAGARAPSWSFDVLVWKGGAFGSVGHFDGVAPALFPYPSGRGLHSSDGPPESVLIAARGRGSVLLVEDAQGRRSYVELPGPARGASTGEVL